MDDGADDGWMVERTWERTTQMGDEADHGWTAGRMDGRRRGRWMGRRRSGYKWKGDAPATKERVGAATFRRATVPEQGDRSAGTDPIKSFRTMTSGSLVLGFVECDSRIGPYFTHNLSGSPKYPAGLSPGQVIGVVVVADGLRVDH